MRERRGQKLLTRRISDEHIVLIRRPINTCIRLHLQLPLLVQDNSTAPRPRGTVADAYRQALNWGYVLSPLGGTSPTVGRGWSSNGPPTQRGGQAVSGPSPGGGRGNNQLRMTYKLPRPDPVRGHQRRETPARRDHQDRLATRPPADGRGRLALPPRTGERPDTSTPSGRTARAHHRDLLASPTTTAPRLATTGHPARQAPHDRRGRRRPRTHRVLLGARQRGLTLDQAQRHVG